MEPEANNLFGEPAKPEEVAIVSIAISLRRLADAISYQGAGLNIFDYIRQIAQSAEESVARR